MDCRLQVNCYYSSNHTAGNEILLSQLTLTLHELLRALSYQGTGGKFEAPMISKYCAHPKAALELFQPFPKLITVKGLGIQAPIRKQLPRNPISQIYTFYTDNNTTTAHMDVMESTWEPRFALKIPDLFIQNSIGALERSINAWKNRYHLERMRQGKFASSAEALTHGWHELRLTISAVSLPPHPAAVRGVTGDTKGISHLRPVFDNQPASQHSAAHVHVTMTSNTRSAVSQLSLGTLGEKLRKVDETLPSLFVKAHIIDR